MWPEHNPFYNDHGSSNTYWVSTASHTHSISSPDHQRLFQKEPSMSINDKIRQERKEKRERARVEAAWEAYDEFRFDATGDGTVIAFQWSPKDSDKVYDYAAIYTNDRWYCTGDIAPKGADHDTFIAWLIDKDVTVDDITWLR